MISSIVFGVMLDKYKKFLITFRVICFGTFIVMLSAFASFTTKNFYVVAITAIIIGILLVPFLPVGSAFAGELTFPMQEAVVIGILQMSG